LNYQLINSGIKHYVGNLRSIIMIRKVSHILLAAFLFLLTSGFTVHQHYCSGRLVETNLTHPPDFCCGEGSDCCSNEQETIQIDADYVDFVLHFEITEYVFDLPELVVFDMLPVRSEVSQFVHSKILHPPDRATALARLQVFCL